MTTEPVLLFAIKIIKSPEGLTKGNEYIVEDTDAGYILSFDKDYLKTIVKNTPVVITYTAEVDADCAVHSINHEVNTVTLEFSNNPHTESDKSRLRDRTNHYTFDIDAGLLGNGSYEATEVVKVGVDAAGNEITRSTTLSNTGKVGALQGAQFALYKASVGENGKWNKDGAPIIANVLSGADGRIRMEGLDAGKYLLEETRAPAGYIREQNPVRIEITATVEPRTYVEDGCTIETDELVSYIVTVNGDTTANYTITNSADPAATSSNKGDDVVGLDGDKGKIKNTKGVELPSTGGTGTTLFYAIGAFLVLLSGTLIVSRRRAGA